MLFVRPHYAYVLVQPSAVWSDEQLLQRQTDHIFLDRKVNATGTLLPQSLTMSVLCWSLDIATVFCGTPNVVDEPPSSDSSQDKEFEDMTVETCIALNALVYPSLYLEIWDVG